MFSMRYGFLALIASLSVDRGTAQADIAAVTNQITTHSYGSVSVIDTSTNTVLASISIGSLASDPFGIAITPNGLFAYVACFNGKVAVIDLSTLSFVVDISIPGFTIPGYVAITPDGLFAYVTAEIGNEVFVIDTSTNTIVGSPIHVGAGPHHISIGVTPNGTYAYVANGNGVSVSIIDTATNLVVQTVAMPAGSQPNDVELAPNGLFAYVTDLNHPAVYVIDTTPFPNTHPTTIPVGATGTTDVTFAPNSLLAYVTEEGSNNVYIIDTPTNTVIPPTISGFSTPIGIGVTTENTFAYVVNGSLMANSVSVVDLATNAITTSIPVDVGPREIAISRSFLTPVTNLTGRQKKRDDFAFIYALYNVLKWGPVSSPVQPIVGYNIYRNGVLIATVGPNTFKFKDHNVKRGEVNTYCVFAFIANSLQSQSACVTIQ